MTVNNKNNEVSLNFDNAERTRIVNMPDEVRETVNKYGDFDERVKKVY